MSAALAALLLINFGSWTGRTQSSAPGYATGGTQACLECHGGEAMTMIAGTAHGDTSNPHTPYAQQGCESCHGPGSAHVSRARGGKGFPALLRFGDRNTRPQQTTACLDCHGRAMGASKAMKWIGSPHDTPRITCVTCHQIHEREDSLGNRDGQVKVCARCHRKDIDTHPKSSARFERLKCSACHDVHRAAD